MKILMISNHLGVQSGVQRYVQNLLLNLDLTRYQVDLFVGLCPRHGPVLPGACHFD